MPRVSKRKRIKEGSHCTFSHNLENCEAAMDFLKS